MDRLSTRGRREGDALAEPGVLAGAVTLPHSRQPFDVQSRIRHRVCGWRHWTWIAPGGGHVGTTDSKMAS